MATEKTNSQTIEEIYNDAVKLLARINAELRENPNLSTINIQMSGVVVNLNKCRIQDITGVIPEE